MLEFWILESPLNTTRGTPARHRAAFGWLQQRRCRGTLLMGWSKRNFLMRNPVRRPLILPKRQRIQSSQPSRWRGKEWNSFHFHIRLKHNRKEKKQNKTQQNTTKNQHLVYSLPVQILIYAANVGCTLLHFSWRYWKNKYFKLVRQLKENLFLITSV